MRNNYIKYISTRGHSQRLDFKDVIFEGLAPDGGLYVPEEWPKFTRDEIKSFSDKPYQEIAFDVISKFTDDSLSSIDLKNIIDLSYKGFDHSEITPLNKTSENEYILELFHGPTYAFKDVAMQFISNLMDFYLSKSDQTINILGATSGDTGAAAIVGFQNIKSARIFILHPHDKISDVQRKFMTTVQTNNVHNIALQGSFDDCQNIIKEIFSDQKYKKQNNLTAINSINWSRIMCQIVYYFYALSRIETQGKKSIFTVPTGNFGDILAGYIAIKMGLSIDMLNIATNENDILTRTLSTGKHTLNDVRATSSPSIDIQISSNFERLLYDITKDSSFIVKAMHELKSSGSYSLDAKVVNDIKEYFCSYSVSQEQVRETIINLHKTKNLVVDPHTAVGVVAADQFKKDYDISIVLSTAHPAKFKDTVRDFIQSESFVPEKINKILSLNEDMVILENSTEKVKELITEMI